jgi:N-acetylglucosaminyl-diphospho-decaprenol L-rhamnosyltransferase
VRASALIVSYNTCALTLEAIASVAREPDTEVVVVDNASQDSTPDEVSRQFPTVHLVRSTINLGYAGGVNAAARLSSGDNLLILNSDARLEHGAFEQLLWLLDDHPRAALVGPRLRYPDGRPQSSGFRFPGLTQVWLDLWPVNRLMDTTLNGRVYASEPREIDHPLGACMLIRREAWNDVGPLDEGYFMYMEEVDWCRRARQRGWQIWYEPRADVVHHGGSSTRQQAEAMFAQLWRSRLRYYARHHGPMYNRLVRILVRLGLRHRSGPIHPVRQLLR